MNIHGVRVPREGSPEGIRFDEQTDDLSYHAIHTLFLLSQRSDHKVINTIEIRMADETILVFREEGQP